MKIPFLLTLLISPIFSNAQQLKTRKEITLPLHPWTALGTSYYVQYEQYNKPKQSFTIMAGYKGTDFLTFFFNQGAYQGQRFAYGRRYYARTQDKWLNFYGEGKLMIEHGRLTLPERFNIKDSLQTSGFTLSPELLAGFKTTILKRTSVSFNLGMRYRINNLNTQKLTYNPEYWKYDDWDNGNAEPAINRSHITNFNKGIRPSINFNIGFVFR